MVLTEHLHSLMTSTTGASPTRSRPLLRGSGVLRVAPEHPGPSEVGVTPQAADWLCAKCRVVLRGE